MKHLQADHAVQAGRIEQRLLPTDLPQFVESILRSPVFDTVKIQETPYFLLRIAKRIATVVSTIMPSDTHFGCAYKNRLHTGLDCTSRIP
jgi:hypothetical protein